MPVDFALWAGQTEVVSSDTQGKDELLWDFPYCIEPILVPAHTVLLLPACATAGHIAAAGDPTVVLAIDTGSKLQV